MKHLLIMLVVCALFAFPSIVRADVAPPMNPPGSNLEPSTEATQVRMVAETVLIDVKSDTTPDSLGSADLTADFTMRNLGTQAENLAVRFPISADNGRGQFPEVTGLVVKVNGKSVATRRVSYPEPSYMGKDVPWAEFQVDFPVDQDVPIEVRYGLQGTGYPPYTAFYYVLETGAGWKDTIGSADIILRLPYEATLQNILVGTGTGWGTTTPGGVIQGNEMRWHFENFEPGPNGEVDNMEFALVAPSAWQPVLKERANVAANPNDGEAWGRLAKDYKAVFFMNKYYRDDPGGEELYQSSIEAYENCLRLLPKDAQWHAGFADLLANRAYWDMSARGATPDLYRALDEIQTALQLAPNDSKVQQIADQMSYMFPDGVVKSGTGYDLTWLTTTPTLNPYIAQNLTATVTPPAELTPPAETTPTATLQTPLQPTPAASTATIPAAKPVSPGCGSAALIPLAIGFWATRKKSWALKGTRAGSKRG